MITKSLIAASALAALMAVSGVANAGPQPQSLDKNWQPNQTPWAADFEGARAMVVTPRSHQYRGGFRSPH